MEFDKSRVYTALNADELKVGSICVFADNLWELRTKVNDDIYDAKLAKILSDDNLYRFNSIRKGNYALAYLVEEPAEKQLKWTDLKVGDVIRSKDGNSTAMVTRIDLVDRGGYECHVYVGNEWFSDEYLAEWEKIEND